MSEDPEAPERPFVDPHEATQAKRMRVAIGGFGAVLFATMVVSMHLSTLELSFGTLVYGSSRVWRGHEANLRVVAVDPRGNMRPVAVTGGELVLRDAGGEHGRYPLAGPVGAVSFAVPNELDDSARIDLRVETELGEDRFEQTLRVVDAPGSVPLRLRSHRELLATRGRSAEGDRNELRLYPSSGVLVDGLDNTVFGWLADSDGVGVISSDAPSFRAELDAHGLFEFRWLPRPSPVGYRFRLGEAPSISRTVNIENEQRQLVVETQPVAFAAAGSSLELVVRTLPIRQPLYLDLWVGDVMPYATMLPASGGRLETTVPLPGDYAGLVRIDVYRNLFAPEHSSSSAHLWVSPHERERAIDEAMRAMLEMPGDDPALGAALSAQGETRQTFAQMAMTRLEPSQIGHRLIRSTVEARREAVETRRLRARSAANTLFVITFALGVALAVGWGIQNHLRVRRQVREVMEDGIAAGEDIDEEAIAGLTRVRDLYDFILVLAALALAAYSILILLQTIRWE